MRFFAGVSSKDVTNFVGVLADGLEAIPGVTVTDRNPRNGSIEAQWKGASSEFLADSSGNLTVFFQRGQKPGHKEILEGAVDLWVAANKAGEAKENSFWEDLSVDFENLYASYKKKTKSSEADLVEASTEGSQKKASLIKAFKTSALKFTKHKEFSLNSEQAARQISDLIQDLESVQKNLQRGGNLDIETLSELCDHLDSLLDG